MCQTWSLYILYFINFYSIFFQVGIISFTVEKTEAWLGLKTVQGNLSDGGSAVGVQTCWSCAEMEELILKYF